MNTSDAIDRLKGFEERLRALGATSLYPFGSTARGEATPTSDLDLFDRTRNPLDIAGIGNVLRHDYQGVSQDILLNAASIDFTRLEQGLLRLKAKHRRDEAVLLRAGPYPFPSFLIASAIGRAAPA